MAKNKRKKNDRAERALKRNLIIILIMLVAMVGVTWAWFTSESSVKVNKIQAGTLEIELVDKDGNSLEGKTLDFIKSDEGEILWEPGATYNLQEIYIKNKGNLDVAYYIEISGATGDTELMDAIDWSFNGVAVDEKYTLKAGMTTEAIVLSGHMKEEAGNEYQNKKIESIAIIVHATQLDSEADSTDNTYDKNAYDDMIATRVSSVSELKSAISNGENVFLTENITLEDKIEIPEDSSSYINLNGKTITTETGTAIMVPQSSSLLVKNGIIEDAERGVSSSGELIMDNVEINAQEYGVVSFSGSIEIHDSKINGETYGIVSQFSSQTDVYDSEINSIRLYNEPTEGFTVAENAVSNIVNSTITTTNGKYSVNISQVETNIKDTKIINDKSAAIASFNSDMAIVLDNVDIEAYWYALSQNGSHSPNSVTIKNSKMLSKATPGIYISNSKAAFDAGKVQTLLVENSEITGKTAVEVKYTDATIKDSKLTATGNKLINPNTAQWGGGYITIGYAFATTTGSDGVPAGGNVVLHNNEYVGEIFNYNGGATLVVE